jgi:hypothetical protein
VQLLDAPELRAACVRCITSRHRHFAEHESAAEVLQFLSPSALQVW